MRRNGYVKIFLVIILLSVSFSCQRKEKKVVNKEQLKFIKERLKNTLEAVKNTDKFPRTINRDGNLVTTDIYNWTSGFFAGNLWYLYQLTGEEKWKTEAEKWTETLDSIQYWNGSHDIGFIINCSYGNGLKLTGKKEYEKVMVRAAKSLIERYNPNVKCIKSWDYRKAWDGTTEWFYPVIIDNMMNLELLFEATLISDDSTFQNIAIQHAETTMKNHYRSDYSSYHVVDYDTITGNVLDKATCQGFVDESSWARGQAWGLYGFTLCYRYTKDVKFLKFAENIANYILNNPHLPQDMVPYWDYNAGDSNFEPEWSYNSTEYSVIPRDASAAAITSSALYELGRYSNKYGSEYKKAATNILNSLKSTAYMGASENKYFILNHSVGSIPHGAEIDVPLVYADYYFLEALSRKMEMNNLIH